LGAAQKGEGGRMIKRRWPWPIKRAPAEDDNVLFILAAFVAAEILLFILIAIF
jgi:hypothetical protein